MEEYVFVQAPVQVHEANIEDQVNDPMEEYVNSNKIVEEDGTNILIQETFNNVGMDYDDKQIDGVFYIPVLEKASQPLYEGSKTSLLFAILLLGNLKVMNGLSNTCVTQLIRHVIYFVTLST
jgi:hypothetical protein